MKKEEYIAKYGEDAWEEKKRKNQAYQKEYYQKHKEETKARSKKWFEEHKEEALRKSKARYENNKETILEKQKQYRDTHKEQIKATQIRYRDNGGYKRHHEKYKEKRHAYDKIYRAEHQEEISTRHKRYMKEYTRTHEGRAKQMIANYSREDLKRERGECNLTPEWFIDNIFSSKCIYCGDDNFLHLGADRVDNSLPHTFDNCICACGVCNIERQCKKMSVSEFIEYRKTHPRDWQQLKPEIVEVGGRKVLKKRTA